MCTLTVVSLDHGLIRLAFNRDEQRLRPEALPPQHRRFGKREAILPIDPHAGGTWLATNDAGLVLALLNVNPPVSANRDVPRPHQSRGTIIPTLLSCDTLDEVHGQVSRLCAIEFAPFRLVVLESGVVASFRSDGRRILAEGAVLLDAPCLFTSSGLGDHLVEGPRRRLFEEMVADSRDPVSQQIAFHRHRWPGREHLSVCMSRPDARTVSYTTVESNDESCAMAYLPDSPDRAVEPIVARLVFQEMSVR